jgi:hypothetical protein
MSSAPLTGHLPPRRTARFEDEPGFCESAMLWLYGNTRLLDAKLACVTAALGAPDHLPSDLDAIEREAERLVLAGNILVCGIHNPAHQRQAVVPLRWGAPRIVVFSGGFYHHLGPALDQEPFRVARLWRYEWDAATDLAISRRAPEKLPTYASHNPAVDGIIRRIVDRAMPGILFRPRSLLR